MENKLQVFDNGTFNVRTIEDDGQIWFVAKDVATALEYSYWQPNIISNVPEIWTGIKRINTSSENGVEQAREVLCLTEQGLYFFLGRSDKPKALPYQMWIAGDVVPAIRNSGVYMTPQAQYEFISSPDFIIKLATEIKNERAKSAALEQQKLALEAKVEQDKPKVIFADAVDASKESILVGNLAKILNQNGCTINGKSIGQNKLFIWLREKGYLMKCEDGRKNWPTQRSLDKGLFEVKERVINNPDGSSRVIYTTKVTSKGQIHFVNLFINSQD